jgi:hypothetical protein
MRIVSKLRPWPVIAAAVVATGVASVGALASQTAAPAIFACAKTKGGAVHIVASKTKCSKREKKLSWSATGPAGADGAPGQIGPAGPVWGLGGAYEANRDVGPTNVEHVIEEFPPTPLTTVATLTGLPAGTYEIRAVTNINTPTGHSFACTLSAGSDSNVAENEGNGEYDAGVNTTTQLLHTFAGAGSATLACASEGKAPADTWSARSTTIIAVPVAAAHVVQVSG